jgi:hypothetical protein
VNAKSSQSTSPPSWRAIKWWPTLGAIAFAAFVASDLFQGEETGVDLAPIVAASGLVYLAAAALDAPKLAWPAFFVSVLVITGAKLGFVDVNATWLLLALAALCVATGLVRGLSRAGKLPVQTLAMLVFGAIAALALFTNERLGAALVAAGLFAHAGWDVYHHWKDKVVVRSLAEFCFVLDTALALAIVATLLRS